MKNFYFIVLGILIGSKLFAQSNTCASATLLTVSTTCTNTSGSTTSATGGGTGCSNGTNDDDVWYQFVATATTATVTVDGANNFDAVVACWTSCAATTSVAGGSCTDNGIGGGTVETMNLTGLTVGNTYFIQVYDWNSGSGSFDICVVGPPNAPSNDNPGGAIAITPSASCSYTTYTNAGATSTTCGTIAAPGCGNYSGGDVWFSVVVPATGGFNIDAMDGVITDGAMAVYSGTACGTMSYCL